MRLGLVMGCCALAAAVPAGAGDAARAMAWPMRIVVVIPDGAEAALGLERRLAAEFTAGLRESGEARAEVMTMPANGYEAARRLRARACEAVVLLGADRPAVLRDAAGRTFAGTLGRAFAYRPAYLLMAGGDPLWEERLAATFPRALRALAESGVGVAAGAKGAGGREVVAVAGQ